MKLTAIVALTIVLSSRWIQTAPQQQDQKSSVAGSVLRVGTNEPVAGAQVVLTRVPPSGAAPSITTDSEGKFVFKDVPSGTYRLSASRNGFARQEFGSRRIDQTGTRSILNVVAGQPVKDMVVRLTPTGSINGRILDASGEPLRGLEVQALRA